VGNQVSFSDIQNTAHGPKVRGRALEYVDVFWFYIQVFQVTFHNHKLPVRITRVEPVDLTGIADIQHFVSKVFLVGDKASEFSELVPQVQGNGSPNTVIQKGSSHWLKLLEPFYVLVENGLVVARPPIELVPGCLGDGIEFFQGDIS